MSELAKNAREAMRDKARRMTSADPHQKVDGSSWEPLEAMNMDVKTGLRPISRQARKRGGKVEGAHAKVRADRKPRKSGGKAIADAIVNRNVKAANEDREGFKDNGAMKLGGRTRKAIGGALEYLSPALMAANALRGDKDDGRKSGGRAKRAIGGNAGDMVPTSRMAFSPVAESRLSRGLGLKRGGHADAEADLAMIKRTVKPEALRRAHKLFGGNIEGDHPKGGRMPRKDGGRAKGKTNINIVIAPGKDQTPPAPAMMPHPPMAPPPMPPPGGPPPMAGPPPGAPGMGAPPPGMPPMPRKRGGRTYRSYKDMDAGSLGGLGRLEKTEIQKHKA